MTKFNCSWNISFFKNYILFLIVGQLLYNDALAMHQHESVIGIYISPPSDNPLAPPPPPTPPDCHRGL